MFINVRVKDDYFNLKYKEITNVGHLYGLEENKELSKRGGTIVGNTRKAIEEETKRPVITSKNSLDFSKLIKDVNDKK